MKQAVLLLLLFWCGNVGISLAQHHPGKVCTHCHRGFSLGGTVFTGYSSDGEQGNIALTLYRSDGSQVNLPKSDSQGRIFATTVDDGRYLMKVGRLRSRTWHTLPDNKDCNTCHISGGNASAERDRLLSPLHTELPETNDCTPCHHFPASMNITRLATPGQLAGGERRPATQGSSAVIRGREYSFNPGDHAVPTVRPDIFAPGYFSLFDMLLFVAERNSIPIAYHWDEDCQTHFIDSVDGIAGNFWYHFSYDAGNGTPNELRFRRQIRWDELLWQPGSWIEISIGDDLEELRREFTEEIARERQFGHLVPDVRIQVNASPYRGNPPESHRITVVKDFQDVLVTPHNLRQDGTDSLYRTPYQPGVVTAMDLLFSLQDQGKLDLVGTAYFTHLAGKVMESYRVRALGFPDEGLAHASGNQGFVYTTGNGTRNRLANDADRKQHVHADIQVIHAPDFALWRWIELGNPYYEDEEPTGVEEMLADYDARDRGFRLQRPWPQPASGTVQLSINVFEPGQFRITLHDITGRQLRTLFDERVENIGIQRLAELRELQPGLYFVRMSDGRSVDVQKIVVE